MKQKRMKQEFFYQKLEKTHTSFVCVATLTLHFKMQGLKERMLLQKWYSPHILHVLFWTYLIEEKFDFLLRSFFALVVLINKVLFSNKKDKAISTILNSAILQPNGTETC